MSNTLIQEVSLDENQFNSLFEAPNGTVTANDIIASPSNDSSNQNEAPEQTVLKSAPSKSPDAETKKQELPKSDLKPENLLNDILTDIPSSNETDKPSDKDLPVTNVLTNIQELLIKENIWVDYENREETELDNETFAEIAIRQAQNAAQIQLRNVVSELPEDAQRLLRYVAQGGDPANVAQLYLQKQKIVTLNPQSVSEKEDFISNYYKSLNWSDSRIQSHMDRLKTGGDASIESEFLDVKPLYTSVYESQIRSKEEQLKLQKQTDLERAELFENNVQEVLKNRTDMNVRDKETVYDYLLNYDQTLADGRKVNKFFVDFAKAQSNLNEYIDLALFLKDKKAYLAKMNQIEKSVASTKSFDFLTSKGTKTTQKNTPSFKQEGTNFNFLT
jgi:hypothetical protein